LDPAIAADARTAACVTPATVAGSQEGGVRA